MPHLSDEKTETLIEFLIVKGLKKERDLRHLIVSALEDHVSDLIDASDVHEAWNKAYGELFSSLDFLIE